MGRKLLPFTNSWKHRKGVSLEMELSGTSQSFWWTKRERSWRDMLLPHLLSKLRLEKTLPLCHVWFFWGRLLVTTNTLFHFLCAERHSETIGVFLTTKVRFLLLVKDISVFSFSPCNLSMDNYIYTKLDFMLYSSVGLKIFT